MKKKKKNKKKKKKEKEDDDESVPIGDRCVTLNALLQEIKI